MQCRRTIVGWGVSITSALVVMHMMHGPLAPTLFFRSLKCGWLKPRPKFQGCKINYALVAGAYAFR